MSEDNNPQDDELVVPTPAEGMRLIPQEIAAALEMVGEGGVYDGDFAKLTPGTELTLWVTEPVIESDGVRALRVRITGITDYEESESEDVDDAMLETSDDTSGGSEGALKLFEADVLRRTGVAVDYEPEPDEKDMFGALFEDGTFHIVDSGVESERTNRYIMATLTFHGMLPPGV